MSYTKSGSLFCPCCGTKITVTNEDGRLFATIRQLINSYDDSDLYEKETPPKGSGKLRPGNLSKKLHEGLHGQAPGEGTAKPKFDRNKYQRELMRKRRAEARRLKGSPLMKLPTD